MIIFFIIEQKQKITIKNVFFKHIIAILNCYTNGKIDKTSFLSISTNEIY